jgi:hypothetical protein
MINRISRKYILAEIARVVGFTARTVYGDVLFFNIPLYGNEEWYSLEET